MGLLATLNQGTQPFWKAGFVLVLLLGFGYVQEGAKVRLNHYIEVAESHPDFAMSSPDIRSRWWAIHAPAATDGLFTTRSTFSLLHRLTIGDLVRFKWLLSAVIVGVFFALDLALLWTLGVFRRRRSLAFLYIITGAVVLAFYALDRGEGGPGYHVSREALGFLQSPLPSLLLVFIPALHSRHAPD